MNRLGIEMLTLLGMPPVDHLRLAADLGCVSISTGLTGLPLSMFGLPDSFHPMWSLRDDPALRREMKAAMADYGVAIGLGEGFRARSDGSVRAYAADLDLLADLGAVRINAVSMEDDFPGAFDELALLAEMAGERGLGFTVEFAPPGGINSLARAVAAVEHVGRGKAQVLLDSMHFFRTGGTLAELAALPAGTIGYVQLADATLLPAESSYMMMAMFARMVPGEGELPLAELVAALPADVPISLEVPQIETFRRGVSPRDHAAHCVAAARALGA